MTIAQRVPLYIAGTGDTSVHLEERALRLCQGGRADRFFPLRRLSRLVVNKRVIVDGIVLLACAEASIPVIFHDDEGQVIAQVTGRPGEMPGLRQHFIDCICRYDWPTLYGQWLFSKERMAIMALERRFKVRKELRTRQQALSWIYREAVNWSDPEIATNTGEWFHLLCFAWMSEQLQFLGLGADDNSLLEEGLPLAGDLARLMGYGMEPLRLGWLRRRYTWGKRSGRQPGPVRMRDMVRIFEQERGHVYGVGRQVITDFHNWLKCH